MRASLPFPFSSSERECTNEPRERTQKRATRKSAQASREREQASELHERTRKRATERARTREPREGTRKYTDPQNKRLARRLPCGLKIINLHLLVNSFPSDRAVLCCCFRINTRLVCVFVWFIYRKRAIIMPHAAGVQDLTESLNRFCLIRFVCVLLGNIYNL